MLSITTAKQLREFADRNGIRDDWHSPDVSCRITGERLNNAGSEGEYEVQFLYSNGSVKAKINLADLFAMACR